MRDEWLELLKKELKRKNTILQYIIDENEEKQEEMNRKFERLC